MFKKFIIKSKYPDYIIHIIR